mgnify:FL=1
MLFRIANFVVSNKNKHYGIKNRTTINFEAVTKYGDTKVFSMANYAIDMSIDGIKDYKLLHYQEDN